VAQHHHRGVLFRHFIYIHMCISEDGSVCPVSRKGYPLSGIYYTAPFLIIRQALKQIRIAIYRSKPLAGVGTLYFCLKMETEYTNHIGIYIFHPHNGQCPKKTVP